MAEEESILDAHKRLCKTVGWHTSDWCSDAFIDYEIGRNHVPVQAVSQEGGEELPVVPDEVRRRDDGPGAV